MSWKARKKFPTADDIVAFVAKQGSATTEEISRLVSTEATDNDKHHLRKKLRAMVESGILKSERDEVDTRAKRYTVLQ